MRSTGELMQDVIRCFCLLESLDWYVEVAVGKRLVLEGEMPPLGVVAPEASAFHDPL